MTVQHREMAQIDVALGNGEQLVFEVWFDRAVGSVPSVFAGPGVSNPVWREKGDNISHGNPVPPKQWEAAVTAAVFNVGIGQTPECGDDICWFGQPSRRALFRALCG